MRRRTRGRAYRKGEQPLTIRLTEREVELMRQMHEEFPIGHPKHWGYRRLAQNFDVAKTTVRRVVNYVTWGRARG
jgi:hypothetical protein